MDIQKMLDELRAEREQIAEAIMILERLAYGQGKRRGRPPAWIAEVKRADKSNGNKRRGKPTNIR